MSVAFSSLTTGHFSKELLLVHQRGFKVPLGVIALFTIVKKGTQLKCTTYGYINYSNMGYNCPLQKMETLLFTNTQMKLEISELRENIKAPKDKNHMI